MNSKEISKTRLKQLLLGVKVCFNNWDTNKFDECKNCKYEIVCQDLWAKRNFKRV